VGAGDDENLCHVRTTRLLGSRAPPPSL
jgi:hypothetical protein